MVISKYLEPPEGAVLGYCCFEGIEYTYSIEYGGHE